MKYLSNIIWIPNEGLEYWFFNIMNIGIQGDSKTLVGENKFDVELSKDVNYVWVHVSIAYYDIIYL